MSVNINPYLKMKKRKNKPKRYIYSGKGVCYWLNKLEYIVPDKLKLI